MYKRSVVVYWIQYGPRGTWSYRESGAVQLHWEWVDVGDVSSHQSRIGIAREQWWHCGRCRRWPEKPECITRVGRRMTVLERNCELAKGTIELDHFFPQKNSTPRIEATPPVEPKCRSAEEGNKAWGPGRDLPNPKGSRDPPSRRTMLHMSGLNLYSEDPPKSSKDCPIRTLGRLPTAKDKKSNASPVCSANSPNRETMVGSPVPLCFADTWAGKTWLYLLSAGFVTTVTKAKRRGVIVLWRSQVSEHNLRWNPRYQFACVSIKQAPIYSQPPCWKENEEDEEYLMQLIKCTRFVVVAVVTLFIHSPKEDPHHNPSTTTSRTWEKSAAE